MTLAPASSLNPGEYPWNRAEDESALPPLVRRVTSWSCVRRRIEELLAAEAEGVPEAK
jgi:hypothetical protein